MTEKYKTLEEVHNRAKDAIGKPMSVLNGGKPLVGKSGPGDAFENWFGKEKDSLSEPDLRSAQVELKATPIKKLKSKNVYSAKERLVLNIINYDDLVKESFETSHFLHKNQTIELAFYEYLKDVPKSDWTFKEVALYSMKKNPTDFEIIRQDWERIKQYVEDGKADQLNEGMSEYLAPCTKGASAKSVRSQPFSDVPAKQRAFSLKSGYMTHLLRTYVLGEEDTESIFKKRFDLGNKSLEDAILTKFVPWQGSSYKEIANYYQVKSKAKSAHYLVASRMLGLSKGIDSGENSNRITEFEKANIMMKTVYFDEHGKNKENMSFKPFSFKKLAKEKWVDENGEPSATWHKFLCETKFLLIVFQQVNGVDTFMGAKFFHVPENEINGDIHRVWQDTVDKINTGVTLTGHKAQTKTGYRITNNFLKASNKMICHIRPHATDTDYREHGRYSNQLPAKINWINRPENHNLFSDDWMTTHSFWLNHDYIKEQVKELLKD